MIELLLIEEQIGVLEEDGKNVLFADCVEFKVSKEERHFLFRKLMVLVCLLKAGTDLTPMIEEGYLAPLDQDPRCKKYNLWEIRDPGRGGRLFFVMDKPDAIIISAVSKRYGSQKQAINRGIKRWETYLKSTKEK